MHIPRFHINHTGVVVTYKYEYDSLGQLVRENNAYAGKTWKYIYDLAGNINYKDEYSYTTGTLPSSPQYFAYYEYSSGPWGKSTRSVTEDTTTIPKPDSTTCKRGTMIPKWDDSSIRTAS